MNTSNGRCDGNFELSMRVATFHPALRDGIPPILSWVDIVPSFDVAVLYAGIHEFAAFLDRTGAVLVSGLAA